MPMDDEQIKAALDDFEEEKFSDAKEKLAGEIQKAKDAFLKDKLKLKGDLGDKEEEDEKDEKEEDEKEEKEEKEEKKDKKATKKRVAKAIKKKQEKEEE